MESQVILRITIETASTADPPFPGPNRAKSLLIAAEYPIERLL